MDIFIGNVPDYFTEADLERLFRGYGSMASYKIVKYIDKMGDEQRFGLSTLYPDEEAIHAIRYLQRYEVDGQPLVIRPYIQRRETRDNRQGDSDIFARIFHNHRQEERRTFAYSLT